MNPSEYERMYSLEDRYWWFVARRRLALGLLRRFAARGGTVLDLGCGTGVVLGELGETGPAVGLDMSPLALGFCRQRGLNGLVLGDGQYLPFARDSFDGLIGLDIFEHIPDDELAFRESFRVLKPGGVLVLSVPAFMSLWGPHDIALMHFRRYRLREAVSRLRKAGFRIEKASYSIFFLFPLVVIVRFFEKRRKGEAKANLVPVPDWANRLLIALQDLEAKLIHAISLPWGSSVVVVARKPDA
ncbi:MAG: methyltransferase domain-containing protein [Fimbriimonadales bacterium]